MKTTIFILLAVGFSLSVSAEEALNQRMVEIWQPRNEAQFQITINVPSRWDISPGMARDENNAKRIEFGEAAILERSTFKGLKITMRKKYDTNITLVLGDAPNEAETGYGVIKGTVYKLFVVFENKYYQCITFYDWQGSPSQKKLFLEMIKNIQIKKL